MGPYLQRFDSNLPFTLDAVVSQLVGREGPLEEPEAILLFLHQFDEMYLREVRT